MVKTTVQYEGDLHCSLTHGPSGRTLDTDAPVDNQGRGESFSPTDLVGSALGSCMATTMGIVAKRQEIDLRGLRVEVVKEMSSAAPRRIARLTTELWLPVPRAADPEGLLEKAALGCPVYLSLNPEIEKPVRFHWTDQP
jgi:putative redox protein